MTPHNKPMHEVLREFTHVLHTVNPMKLNPDNPVEYEFEALSILSRFAEAALQIPDESDDVTAFAANIVKECLSWWVDDVVDASNTRQVTELLLNVYRSAYAVDREHKTVVEQIEIG